MVNSPVKTMVQNWKIPTKDSQYWKDKENQTNKISEIIFLVSSKHGHFLCKI